MYSFGTLVEFPTRIMVQIMSSVYSKLVVLLLLLKIKTTLSIKPFASCHKGCFCSSQCYSKCLCFFSLPLLTRRLYFCHPFTYSTVSLQSSFL